MRLNPMVPRIGARETAIITVLLVCIQPIATQIVVQGVAQTPPVALLNHNWTFEVLFAWDALKAPFTQNTTVYYTVEAEDRLISQGSFLAIDNQTEELRTNALIDVASNVTGYHAWLVNMSTKQDMSASTSAAFNVHTLRGGLTLLPPLLTLLCVVVTKDVLLSLFAGVFLAAFTIYRFNPIAAFARTFDTFVLDALADNGHAQVILFTWFLSGMVACVLKSGGGSGLVTSLSKFASTPRAGALLTVGLGLIIFFDGIANTLIVGQTVRPITDALHISREKLAFLVDATSSPITSISPVSTWVGFELSLIQNFLDSLRAAGDDVTCYDSTAFLVFVKTIPGRFYPFVMIALQLMLIWTQRDFGPMLAAERRARTLTAAELDDQLAEEDPGHEDFASLEPDPATPKRWWSAVVPVATTTIMVIIVLIVTGVDSSKAQGLALTGQNIFGNSDSYSALLFGSVLGSFSIFFLAWAQRVHWRERSANSDTSGSESTTLSPQGQAGKKPNASQSTSQGFENDADQGAGATEASATMSSALITSPASSVAEQPTPQQQHHHHHEHSLQEPASASSSAHPPLATHEPYVRWFRLSSGPPVMSWTESLDTWILGIKNLTSAVLILLLAWSVGDAFTQCGTGTFIASSLVGNVAKGAYPVLAFLLSALLAVVTGSSWGTMGIMFPLIVPASHHAAPCDKTVVYGTIGSILAGAVFGDHCSPISDTTILSSIACRCDLKRHVKTQLPYALLCGIVGALVGDLPAGFDVYPEWVGLVLSILIGLVIGYVVTAPIAPMPSQSPQSPLMRVLVRIGLVRWWNRTFHAMSWCLCCTDSQSHPIDVPDDEIPLHNTSTTVDDRGLIISKYGTSTPPVAVSDVSTDEEVMDTVMQLDYEEEDSAV
eukprot:m.21425 g.21425  ORF g.21425 m.21425 type:complete len:889 (-) comp8281_c0_seq2:448-3114(-)